MQILFVYIYIQRDQFASETPHAAKTVNVVAPSLVRINIDSFLVLVSGKFPCFLEIDILFILNYKSRTKLAKNYSTGNAMFVPTYNKRTNALVKTAEELFKHVEKRMRSYTCLVSG